MITFSPLQETLKKKGISSYQLIETGVISTTDLVRLKRNHNFTLKFVDRLCVKLGCDVSDVIAYAEDIDIDNKD
jgi:putative transcriptional regulator